MAIFCKYCMEGCCNHCEYYLEDAEDAEEIDEYLGTCGFDGTRTEPLSCCNHFLCVGAFKDGYGYSKAIYGSYDKEKPPKITIDKKSVIEWLAKTKTNLPSSSD